MKLDPDPEKEAWLKATVLFLLAAPFIWLKIQATKIWGKLK